MPFGFQPTHWSLRSPRRLLTRSAPRRRRRVQSAGLVEHALMAGELVGQRSKDARRDRAVARADRRAPHLDLLERGLAADPARRVGHIATIAYIVGNRRPEPDGHDVEQL